MAASLPMVTILWVNRLFRGLSQGILLVWFLPDLHAMGWSPVKAGLALSTGLLFDFLLTLLAGHLSDRMSPVPILLAGEVVSVLPCLLYLIDPLTPFLWVAAALSGLGQRSNGSPGPTTPAEQSLILRIIPLTRLFPTVSANLSAGLFGMAAGAFAGAFLPALKHSTALNNLRGILFFLVFSSLLNILLLVRHTSASPRTASPVKPPGTHQGLLAAERKNLFLLAASNSLFGLSMGLIDPSISYWFLIRFKAVPTTISSVLGLSFLSAALFSAFLARNHPPVHIFRVTVILQLTAVISLFLLPFPLSLTLACVLFTLRFACLRGPGGIRQALAGTLVRPEHRGWAQSIHLSSLGVASVFGPSIAGLFWKKGMIDAPLFLGAAAGLLSLALFLVLYRNPSSWSYQKHSGIAGSSSP